MCHFRRIYHFFAIWFQNFFWALTVIKDFFSKTCKTPKTAENRGTVKTKVVELGIIFHMHAFKIWKNEKNFFRKKNFFYQNDIEKKFFRRKKSKIEFDTSKWRARWVDYDYGRFFSLRQLFGALLVDFLVHFWGGLIGPTLYKGDFAL